MLDDLVDIVVNNEGYKRKLVFINVKNQKNSAVYESVLKELKERAIGRNEVVSYTVPQLRNKFKRCVFECKRACLTVRTATGIKRLSDSKGKWFDLLYPVVKCRDSCNPELASEPSAVPKEQKPSDAGKEAFVPTHSKKRKRADAATESTDQILTLVKDTIANDPTQKLLDFMKAEMERERKHEAELFSMILQGGNNTLQQVGAQYMPPIPYGSVPYPTMLPNPQQAAAPSFDYNFQGPSPSGL